MEDTYGEIIFSFFLKCTGGGWMSTKFWGLTCQLSSISIIHLNIYSPNCSSSASCEIFWKRWFI